MTERRLVDGINHIASVTKDFDRLSAFYKQVFDAEVVAETHSHGLRHAFIQIGPNCVLHAFEMPDSEWTKPGQQIFQRGRLDHIAINAASQHAFETIRGRLMAEGASDGTITDFGAILSVFFRDPDGMDAEVCVMKDGAAWSDAHEPEGWVPPNLRD